MNTSQWNLGDPEWELIDPTPNVHALFVQFNSKFFWSKLGSVSVRWSKRMYSCAGICRYEGRGGMCDIGLSEPLLKLRPRKDLVETLLHEMIHAFLFLTDGDRDRDGHGPNFQHHMRRINKAASVNITIYHDFHDEVKLYQTHWWRCDGPCQNRKPFFGVVRRTCNRAPGPNDFWWTQHQATCGGKFIKTKEPEKKQRTSIKPKTINNNTITKYINNSPTASNVMTIADLSVSSPANGTKLNGGKTVVVTKRVPNTPAKNTCDASIKTLVDYWSVKGNQLDNNINLDQNAAQTVRNHWANKLITPPSGAKNNKRHSDVINSECQTPPMKVIKLNNTLPTSNVTPLEDFTIDDANALLKDIYGDGFTLNKAKYDSKFSPPTKTVKKKNETLPNSTNANMTGTTKFNEPSLSVPSTSSNINRINIPEETHPADLVDCPSCNKKVKSILINEHLDICTVANNKVECPSCSKLVEDITTHKNTCVNKTPDFVLCPSCQEIVADINEHLDICLAHNKPIESAEMATCPSCNKKISQAEINGHLDVCLSREIIESIDLVGAGPPNNCPVCNVNVPGSLEEHLEICLAGLDGDAATSNTMVTASVSLVQDNDDDFNDSGTFNSSGTMHPCPCCMHMVEANVMNNHIDQCLKTG